MCSATYRPLIGTVSPGAQPTPPPTKPFTSVSRTAWRLVVSAILAAVFVSASGPLSGAGYRVRTDDIQLGKLPSYRVNPACNASKRFTVGVSAPPVTVGEIDPGRRCARWLTTVRHRRVGMGHSRPRRRTRGRRGTADPEPPAPPTAPKKAGGSQPPVRYCTRCNQPGHTRSSPDCPGLAAQRRGEHPRKPGGRS
jgi:hypothetical protein